jgi:hypothetical protein
MRPSLIPIVIAIFRSQQGEVEYKAFSPKEYGAGSESRRKLYDKFMEKLYEHISYDPITSETSLGKLLEVHTRFIRVPLSQRRDKIHFNTYRHQHTEYKPVHGASPLGFTEEYSSTEGLTHIVTSHERI